MAEYDTDGKRIIKQDGKTYRQDWLGNWQAETNWLGQDKVETDWLGKPKIETDWLGQQKIETDWLGTPIVPPETSNANRPYIGSPLTSASTSFSGYSGSHASSVSGWKVMIAVFLCMGVVAGIVFGVVPLVKKGSANSRLSQAEALFSNWGGYEWIAIRYVDGNGIKEVTLVARDIISIQNYKAPQGYGAEGYYFKKYLSDYFNTLRSSLPIETAPLKVRFLGLPSHLHDMPNIQSNASMMARYNGIATEWWFDNGYVTSDGSIKLSSYGNFYEGEKGIRPIIKVEWKSN